MKSLSETLLLKLPPLLQNIILSFYGRQLVRRRYGGDYEEYLKEACFRLDFNGQQMKEYADKRLMKIVTDAASYVPYYRKLFHENNINPKDIKTVDDLERIPLLVKKEIRENIDQFIDERFDKKKLLCIHTTGTTSTPLNIYCDESSRQRNYAYYERFLMQNGLRSRSERATLGGRIILKPDQEKPPFWRYSYFQKNLLFSSYHLKDQNIPSYIEKLISFKPDYIDSYPSSLFTIANYAKKNNIDLRGITKGITTSAETLFPEQRDVIEGVFGVSVADQYGAAEMCVFVGQCRHGSYHIHSDYSIVEFLRQDGSKANLGEEAEIFCTGFINPIMPLIRYRIGDRGVLGGDYCTCGSVFPVMEKLLGRIDDVILTPDGRKIGRLSPVLKGFPIKEAQYVQKNINLVTVFIIKDMGYEEKTEKDIVLELRKRLGNEINITIQYVNEISRSSGGKLKNIISEIQ